MKDIVIINGERASGKTYKMISYAVKSSSTNSNNVFIIATSPRSFDYFEHIIMKEYPSLRFERRKDGFLFETPTYSWFIYCVPLCDIHNYYIELSMADEIMIDEYTTFTYLIKDKNIVDCMQKATTVILTISDYYFNSVKFGVIDVIKKLGAPVTITRIQNG